MVTFSALNQSCYSVLIDDFSHQKLLVIFAFQFYIIDLAAWWKYFFYIAV